MIQNLTFFVYCSMTVEHSLILPSVNRSRWRVREREREREADLDVKRIEQLESSYPLHPE